MAHFFEKMEASKTLVEKAVAYQDMSSNHTKTLLVIGDSTGVGVGAKVPDDTIAARLAHDMHATYVENRAVSGAMVADMPAQVASAALPRYDAILVQIGGNDITHLHSPSKVSAQLGMILRTLKARSNRVTLMSAGNVGGATILPRIVRPLYTWLNLRYHRAFARVAAENSATYINLYIPPAKDPFNLHPEIYLAEDGFHPSSAGYAVWYEKVREAITP